MSSFRYFFFLLTISLTVSICTCFVETRAITAAEEKPIDYNRDIKPLLSDRCYACHGPDKNHREADFRLDDRDSALEFVIEPGDAANSVLIERLTTDDPEALMPPPHSKKKPLTAEQVALIRRWIDQGAKYDAPWAYGRPKRTAPAEAKNSEWNKSLVDQFISAKLQEMGMAPSAEADQRTLIRRLSFDLTGLPPTAAQIAEFENNKSHQAYEQLVDRLIGSEQYGERMAAFWLDLVRYADTNGIHGDNHRDVYLFRDWVIQSFNENKPFDQFTTEQLAGDLLDKPTRDQRIASGYNRMLMTTREGGAQAKEYRAKYSADRVRNFASVWLGSTLGCCECHDHKFDPFTTKEFYSLAAFFADIQEVPVGVQPGTKMPTAEQTTKMDKLQQQIAPLEKMLTTQTPQLDEAQVAWEKEIAARSDEWKVLRPEQMNSKGGAELTVLEDGSILVSGENPSTDVYTLVLSTELKGITALRLEALSDDSLPVKGPGRAGNGNFVISELKLKADGKVVEFSSVTATHSQTSWVAASAADGKPETGWAILPQLGKANSLVFETKTDLGGEKPTTLSVELHQNHPDSHNLGHFRISATTAKRPIRAGQKFGLPGELAAIVKLTAEKRSAEQKKKLADHYRTLAPLLDPMRKQLAELKKQKGAIDKASPTMLVSTAIAPREIRVLPRGNWLDDSGEIVKPIPPKTLGQLSGIEGRATRKDLAKWLVSKQNPITARVFVNRLWKLAFGRGIVSSMDDFGSQGIAPSHPELLDSLAVEFMESGWNVKHLFKLIVMSRTYRQSSLETEQQRQSDPGNRWLARQGRFRLDAEMVRDNALAVSGLLSSEIGGRSVKPYQPSGYWSHLNFPRRTWKSDQGDNLYRRGLYTYWCRTFLHPSMLAFDAPSREECSVERPRSNTPQQALVLMNDPTFVESSRAFAARILKEGGKTDQERLSFAFRHTLGREPKAEEAKILLGLREKHLKQYQENASSADEILSVGAVKAPQDVDKAELASWTSVARVIFNLHEMITRY